jgi:hypothetical protein
MVSVECDVCADRYRRHWFTVVLTALLSPLVWAWAVVTALGRVFHPRQRSLQPRLCLLAGSRHLRRDTARALRGVLAELARFESKALLDLVIVQDRVTRPDGEPLRVAVARSRRAGTTLLTVRLALHARGTCYGPEALAATLADTLVALYELEAQAAPVLEVPARVPREAPAAVLASAPSRNGVSKTALARTHIPNGVAPLARARVNDEADGTIAQFKPRPGGPNSNEHA